MRRRECTVVLCVDTQPGAHAVAVRVWCRPRSQEKELRDKERLEVLKRANDLLVSQTDRMAALRTQKTLSDVADVRAVAVPTRRPAGDANTPLHVRESKAVVREGRAPLAP